MKFDFNLKITKEHQNWLRKQNWLWAILLIIFGAVFSTVMIQYLLLDGDLFAKLSDKKWITNIYCVLAVYLLNLCITARVNLAIIISHTFFMVLGFVNYFVYLHSPGQLLKSLWRMWKTHHIPQSFSGFALSQKQGAYT